MQITAQRGPVIVYRDSSARIKTLLGTPFVFSYIRGTWLISARTGMAWNWGREVEGGGGGGDAP